jgi:hypothetical protein
MEIRDEIALHTGDILLFKGTSIVSHLLEWLGVSKYSHVGIVLKNPKFLNPDLEDGIYVLESTMYNEAADAENNQHKMGVQIHHIDDILASSTPGSVFVRQVHCTRNEEFYKNFNKIHETIHNKPYDLNWYDWICAKYNISCELPEDAQFKSTSHFWCSALVAYVLCELGLIEKDINWSLMAPREFSSQEGKYIKFICKVNDEKNIY